MAKSTAVAKSPKSSVVDIRQKMATEIQTINDRLGAAGGDKIQVTQSKTFRFPDGRESSDPFKAVIVDWTSGNFYYDGPFDKDNISAPACFAIGADPDELVPSKNSPEKQADTCAVCPMNAFGSAQNGKGKACKNSRLLALLPPDADEDTPLAVLQVSPTALKAFDGYVRAVVRQHNVMPRGVITEIGFDPKSDFPSLRFGNPEPNPNLELAEARLKEAEARLAQEPDVSTYEPYQPPQPKVRKAAGRK